MSPTDLPDDGRRFHPKELQLPETAYVRDIDDRVFQEIVRHCVARVEGVALLGSFIDSLLGGGPLDGMTQLYGHHGITVEQDSLHGMVSIKVAVGIGYQHAIPDKAEELQTLCSQEITRLTGLHVHSVHVVFKQLLTEEVCSAPRSAASPQQAVEDIYTETF